MGAMTVREMRKAAGFTHQGKFAKQIGCAAQYLGAWERGERELPELVVRRIAKALGVSLDELLSAPFAEATTKYMVCVAVRDGKTVRVKRCHDCQQVKIVDDTNPSLSEFSTNGRNEDGTAKTFCQYCKKCANIRAKQRRDADPERAREIWKGTYDRIRADPERDQARRVRMRAAARRSYRRNVTPEVLAAKRKYVAEYRERKLAEDPEYFSMARRRERKREKEGKRPMEVVTNTEPFRMWILAYSLRRRLWRTDVELAGKINRRAARSEFFAETVADDLGIEARRLRSVMAGDQDRVSVEIVDAAITNSDVVITVLGKDVWSVGDLYDLKTDVALLRRVAA